MAARNRVVVLGTGNIGADLCERLLLQTELQLVALVGRRPDSPGLTRFAGRGIRLEANGLESLKLMLDDFDGVFDATSAQDHHEHWEFLNSHNKWVVDLTPSRLGVPFVPVLSNRVHSMWDISHESFNYSMISCGGQASAPVLFAIATNARNIHEVEVSSSIAALSAGPATRRNIDEYIDTTENLARVVSGCSLAKAILVLNPAEPPIMMRTTVHIRAEFFDEVGIQKLTKQIVREVQDYVPGYDLVVEPHFTDSGHMSATVKVTGAGYYLPEYAGNLDIINAAAVETALRHSKRESGES